MGHYAVEMRSDDPLEPIVDDRLHWFVVDTDFTVQTAQEFLDKNNGSEGAHMRLMFMTRFEHRLQAELYARDDCERAVETARARLLALKKLCKVTRPWEKK
jgi:hypothetical protein